MPARAPRSPPPSSRSRSPAPPRRPPLRRRRSRGTPRSGSPRTVVAVLDSGVDPAQPDLRGALVPGRNVLAGDDDTRDDNGHGTLVAGIVAARSDNRIGVAGFCPSCAVMPVKVLDAGGHGSGPEIAAGIDWAVVHGPAVANMSFRSSAAAPPRRPR
ncbi:MAG TPA: S8 family serine peptidase [Gaiellaceae bacterium]|nr:S8 family serine peptidase [Gaiellaceae bacterium]